MLKFSRDGKFLLQIGKPGKSEGSNSATQFGRPAHMDTDLRPTRFLSPMAMATAASRCSTRRPAPISGTGARTASAPNDDKQPPFNPAASPSKRSFRGHCVRLSRDGLFYVCDRGHNRIQVFH